MNEQLSINLERLELQKIQEIFPDYIRTYLKSEKTPTEMLYELTEEEISYRKFKSSEAIIKSANFPFKKTFEDFEFNFQPSVNESQLRELGTLGYLEDNENIIFIGNPGVGKTHLAVALGIKAARERKSVYFTTCHNLIIKLNRAHKENRLDKQLRHLAQYKLLIIDEVGYLPIDNQGSNLFFQLIAKRYMSKSTIITTNMPFSRWGEVFCDNTLASAVLDRLIHYSHIIRITGNSYRIKDKLSETDSRTNKYNE
ncbi:MAG: IS21-like element helper ATPase IstB [Bacilli bacterium]|nr:IS21-like element helper ATPase IstB [Bacilli bacterium]